jgi:hypothetical protein
MAEVKVDLHALHDAYYTELRKGSFNINQLLNVSRRSIIEINKRNPEHMEKLFGTTKRFYMKYWLQYKSPQAIRRMQEERLSKMNEEQKEYGA